MNLQFLGDALDHWKGSLLESLQQARVVRNLAADPMASDQHDWQPQDFSLFARLLRIDRARLVPHQFDLSRRKEYFEEITHVGDLFVDPDTGVATSRVKELKRYIKPSEIAQLLNLPDRLLVVYQHIQRQKVAARISAVGHVLEQSVPGLHWCSYESASVAMLFLSRVRQRTAAVETHFFDFLGRHAERRIRGSGRQA
ncbi:MAG: hypothetical protein QN178_10680 [Armatimonadota bacterium]|nr:hypothetical protein [Armatimonadota bacterium]